MHRTLSVTILLCAALPATLAAERPQFSVDAEFRDAYVWRGQLLTDGAVAQPGVTATLGRFSAGVWTNLVLDGSSDHSGQFSEIDYFVLYAFGARAVSMETGLTAYRFPNATLGSTSEVHFATDFVALPFEAGVAVHYDFDQVDGFYTTASIGKQFPVHRSVELGLAFSTGWSSKSYNAFYFGVNGSRVNDGNLLLESTFAVGRDMGLSVGIQYSWLWNSDIEDGATALYTDDSHLGLVFGLNFDF